jgi:hypothetical protein
MLFQKNTFLLNFQNFQKLILKNKMFIKEKTIFNITALYIKILFKKNVVFIYYFNRQLKGISLSILKKIILNFGYLENTMLHIM